MLKGKRDSYLRLRVGDYRVVYRVQEEILTVLVIRVGHRREVYIEPFSDDGPQTVAGTSIERERTVIPALCALQAGSSPVYSDCGGCWWKNRTISAEASGPLGSVYEPGRLPPDQACPRPCTVHRSMMARPSASWYVAQL